MQSFQKLILACAILLSFFAGLGSAPLFDKDEGAFCEATREMVASGNYLMTYLNGEPRYDKPILIYWLQAASAHIFGMNEFALRLPSAVAAAAWALLTYAFTKRVLDADKAFLAAFFLVTTAQITVIGKAAIADALLNLCIAGAMFALYLYYEQGTKRWLYLGALAIGLGTLTKGPMAFLVPVVPTFLFCLWQGDLRRWLRGFLNPLAWVIFLATTAPWVIAAYMDQGPALIEAWLEHTVGRANDPMEGHTGPFYYYLPVLLAGLAPYTALFFWSFAKTPGLLRDPLTRYALTWFGFVFVFMSLLATKLPHYIIYGYTPLFLVMARALADADPPANTTARLKRDGVLMLPAVLFAGLMLAVPYLVTVLAGRVEDPFVATVLESSLQYMGAAFTGVLCATLAVLLAVTFSPWFRTRSKLACAGIAVVCLVNFVLLPVVAKVRQEPIREAALLAKEADYDVVVWDLKDMPSFVFYREALVRYGIPGKGDIVLTERHNLEYLESYELLYEKNGIALARVGGG